MVTALSGSGLVYTQLSRNVVQLFFFQPKNQLQELTGSTRGPPRGRTVFWFLQNRWQEGLLNHLAVLRIMG